MSETILLIDDDKKMKSVVAEVMQHEGLSVLTAMNGTDGLRIHENYDIDLVLLDIKLPDIGGIELLKQFVHKKPLVPVIMISGCATIDCAVAATKLGAYDFLEKPLEPQRVLITIRNALEKAKLEKIQNALVGDMMNKYGIIGTSEALKNLCTAATRISRHDTPVLIVGDNGTGKELIASIIHQFSGRKTMVHVNCAAVPRELIESELFGHKKGAFTGAIGDKLGKFKAADGGTLFLDEIGDMAIEMQAKILRALEVKEICMIGSNEIIRVDVRIIAATNHNLEEAIKQGKFREDLYYRLRGITLFVPPLRDRKEDIKPLGKYFLKQFCEGQGIPEKILSEDAIQILREQEWRGNVRELKHFIEYLAIFCEGPIIEQKQVLQRLILLSPSEHTKSFYENSSSIQESTKFFEKTLILQTLKETGGNITCAATKLHIERATLSKKIKRLGIKNVLP